MAQVDFSNARIEPWDTTNNTAWANLNLDNGDLYAEHWVQISSGSVSRLINQQKQLMYLYQGTFTASGTEFYVSTGGRAGQWKVSNISFSNGDTYVFQINASLVCN